MAGIHYHTLHSSLRQPDLSVEMVELPHGGGGAHTFDVELHTSSLPASALVRVPDAVMAVPSVLVTNSDGAG